MSHHSLTSTVTFPGGAVARVESCNFSMSKEVAEVRALDSTWVERYAGLNDGGSVEITGFANGSNYTAIVGAMQAGTVGACSLTTPADSATFRGIITACTLIADASDVVKFSATVMAAGAP